LFCVVIAVYDKARMKMSKEKTKKHVQRKQDKPVANPTVVLREEFDDWAILFNPDTADAVGTNPVGVTVWKLMDGRRSLEEIVAEIQDQFADVPEAAAKDVTTFIKDLVKRGFVGYELKGQGT
jgi:SynChlorMet cassette protein ScmD